MKNVYVEVNEQYFWLNSNILTFTDSDAWINETIIQTWAYKIFYFFGLYVENIKKKYGKSKKPLDLMHWHSLTNNQLEKQQL